MVGQIPLFKGMQEETDVPNKFHSPENRERYASDLREAKKWEVLEKVAIVGIPPLIYPSRRRWPHDRGMNLE